MKKILFISQSLGGVANSLNLIISNIDSSKYEITLVAPPNKFLEGRVAKAGFRYIKLEMKRSVGLHDLLDLYRIFRIMNEQTYDLIHCHSAKAGVLGRLSAFLSGKKVIYSPRGWSYLSQDKKWKQKFYCYIEKLMVPFTDLLIVASASEAELGLNEVGFSGKKIRIVRNSFFPEEIENVANSESPFPEKYILTIGRVVYQKNLEQFIDVAEILHQQFPQLKFVIKGTGFKETFESELEEKARQTVSEKGLDSTVLFFPWGDKSETLNWIKHCELYVHTARFEALPNVILEAMALGKAVVSTNAIGNKDAVVDHTTGYLTELYDRTSMAEKIKELLDNADLKSKFGNDAKQYAFLNYNIKVNIRHLEKLYDYLLLI